MSITIPKSELRKQLHEEVIASERVFYSYVEKSQQTLSMMKNQRFLIFNQNKGQLFYINAPKTVPFLSTIPKPKNNVIADLNLTTTLKSTGANEFNIQFTFLNKDNKPQTGEWNFITQTKQLAAAWVKLLAEYFEIKKKRLEQEEKNKKEVTNFNFNRRGSGYNYSKVEDLGYREDVKLQQKPVTHEQKPPSILDSRTKPIPPITPITPPQPTITITQPLPKPQPSQPSIPINNPSRGSLYNSQQSNRYQQLSPQKKSQAQQSNKNSRLTFKDEIQSIIDKNSRVSLEGSRGGGYGQNMRQSTVTKQAYNKERDWNWRFYTTPTQQVISEFQQYSISSFTSILSQDRLSNQPLRVYLQPQSLIIVTNFGSIQAKKIKSQFRNYHFIMQAIKGERFGNLVGVPLTCLIEYEGLVVMVKSMIPQHAPKVECTYELMMQMKDLERYTRVKNSILKKSTLYDLSDIYQTSGRRLLYINQLIEYLPAHMDEMIYGSLLRPEHMLDNVDQFMHGGLGYEAMRQDVKMFEQTVELIKKNTRQLAKEISCGDVKFANGQQLKNIMHERGINLKYLPLLYNETTNKHIKKFVHSFMIAKVTKEDILSSVVSTRADRMKSTKPQMHVRELVQQSIKLLVEGNSNVSSELWKDLSLSFKRQYGFQLSTSDIHGPFLLHTLLRLLKIDYDLGRINMKKVMFKDDRIIQNGFVVGMGMKVKSYYRWMTRDAESVMHVCKLQKRDVVEFMGVCELLQLKKKSVPKYLQLVRITPYLQEYLTSFIPPPQFQAHEFKHLSLYSSISSQPPTSHSLTITLNYLKWCLQYNRIQEFKLAMDEALQLIDVWLGHQGQQKGSFQHCEFYEVLSDFYFKQGNVDDSVNFLKQSLATMIRNNGLGSKKIADGYYMLGEREMKLGRWPQALQNFLKAKQSMQASKSTQHINYPKSLLKLSQLYLQSTQFQSALLCAKQSIQQFQKQQSLTSQSSSQQQQQPSTKQLYDEYCIKAIEVMCRVFQIEGKKNELHRVAQMTAAKYNKTKSELVYQQLVKMTLISVINRTSMEKCRLFLSLIEKVFTSQNNNNNRQNQHKDDAQRVKASLQELMQMSAQYNVMEKFMFKFDSLERIVLDINGKRSIGTDTKEFITILRPIVDLVGEEFIIGLVEQREMQQ